MGKSKPMDRTKSGVMLKASFRSFVRWTRYIEQDLATDQNMALVVDHAISG
jgi:hypothetical protein